MRIFCAGLLVVAATMLAGPLCLAEQVALNFDGRKWEIGHSAESKDQGIREYVLKGETVDNWTELVTVQAFFGLQDKATPEEYMEGMMAELKKNCPGAIWDIVRKGDDDIVFIWQVKDSPGQEDQYEVDRIISGKNAMYILHYATKKLPVAPEKRDKWIKLLDSAKLVNK